MYCVGKTRAGYLREAEAEYQQRLSHYLPITFETIPDIKGGGKLSSEQLKQREGEAILRRSEAGDYLVLLDEGGKQFGSVDFAQWLDRRLQHSSRRLVFVVGGAFGFAEAVYARANAKLSLSKMTFSHQMIRTFLSEQLYRAMTILRGENYHNV